MVDEAPAYGYVNAASRQQHIKRANAVPREKKPLLLLIHNVLFALIQGASAE